MLRVLQRSIFQCCDITSLLGIFQVDTNALPTPDWDKMAAGDEYIAPEGDLEERVHEVWAAELGLSEISTRTNFFKAGGTSLLAGVVAFRLSKALEASIPATLVFGHPTIASLAANISAKPQSKGITSAPYSQQHKVHGCLTSRLP